MRASGAERIKNLLRKNGPMSLDDIVEALGWGVVHTSALVVRLLMKGEISADPEQRVFMLVEEPDQA